MVKDKNIAQMRYYRKTKNSFFFRVDFLECCSSAAPLDEPPRVMFFRSERNKFLKFYVHLAAVKEIKIKFLNAYGFRSIILFYDSSAYGFS